MLCVTRVRCCGVEGVDRLFGCARERRKQTSAPSHDRQLSRHRVDATRPCFITRDNTTCQSSVDLTVTAEERTKIVGTSHKDERSKVYLPFSSYISKLQRSPKPQTHQLNSSNLLSHSRIRSRDHHYSHSLLSVEETALLSTHIVSTECKIFLNQDFSVTNPLEVRSNAKKSQVQ